jgi:hypothetical protein
MKTAKVIWQVVCSILLAQKHLINIPTTALYTADVSIKCEGPDSGPYKASLGYASFTAVLFPLGIPMYYMLSLFRMRAAINPSLHVIMKDKDYIAPWACPPGRIFIDELGQPMKGKQLLGARNVAKQEWVRRNPKLAACLVGKDYTSQFEQRQKRDGYKKAKDFIQRKARASSIPANRFKFLWVSECSLIAPDSLGPNKCMCTTGTLQNKVLVLRGCRYV